MNQNKKYIDILVKNKGAITFLYIGLMLVFYLGFVLLDNNRINKSEHWLKTNYLTQEDIQRIQGLGTWTSVVEFLFIGLFILTAITLFYYRKKRSALSYFIVLHLCLFLAIFGLGYVLSFFLTTPIGNLTQPLILPTFLLLIIASYAIFVRLRGQLEN
ncbi:hypothetical protein AWH56_018565 [Anaerobacillus isosaccharinicus]|uniref:Uncharacterized protein n=1 Tax=Anaerobacillus isosaccharinicus TaxID=1532552 RepID=A0A1S2LFX2_9BACI|nr:hypothetical protein [Anaerobacillus isosaccharinicus]MBA5587092.1 hypothetical protein [Anaerobacillus isosaccharinicus]QOY34712.1 hypothetical protein AWH56_018565 [Anaerobacillus isosaccharinicus]